MKRTTWKAGRGPDEWNLLEAAFDAGYCRYYNKARRRRGLPEIWGVRRAWTSRKPPDLLTVEEMAIYLRVGQGRVRELLRSGKRWGSC